MSNIADNLRTYLHSSHLRLIERTSAVCSSRSEKIYLAGGVVRDVLLGTTPSNLDIVVVHPQYEFVDHLARGIGGEVVSRSQFDTFKIIVSSDEIDVATARREEYIRPGALPTVEETSIEEDLSRRDFSVNSMAVSLNQDSWGELLDPHGGEGDLKQKLLRVLHERSFIDDPTRILRAIRYAVRLNFHIHSETYRLFKRDMVYLQDISGDRVRHELERTMTEPFAWDVLLRGEEEGVLSAIHSGLKFGRIHNAVNTSNEQRVEGNDVVLAALIYFSSDVQMGELAIRLKMGTRWSRIVREVRLIKSASQRLRAPGLSRSELFTLLCDLHPEVIHGCAITTQDTAVKSSLYFYLNDLRCIRPSIDGDDLLALGVPEGPQVGELLDRLLHDRLEGLLSSRADEEAFVVNKLKGCLD
ncbi:MAG: hypothetical protein QGF12_08210 [SAR202 cluster bacterium]|nr:hypothetical protein [SAR202 cluster bacterium]